MGKFAGANSVTLHDHTECSLIRITLFATLTPYQVVKWTSSVIMPPTLEKLKGHIAKGHNALGSFVRAYIQNLLRYSFEIPYIDSSSKNNLHIFF